MMEKTKVLIKLLGEEKPIKNVLKKLENLYPINISSQPKKNEKDEGFHLFITVQEEA